MPMLLAAVADLYGSSYCPLSSPCCHCFLSWDCRSSVTKRGRCPWLITREPASGGAAGFIKGTCAESARGVGVHVQRLPARIFLCLSLFLFPLFFPHCLLLSIFTNGDGVSDKWAEDRALRDRCIPWSWSWRLGSMVIITPKSDPNTHLVTLSWSVWGSSIYEGNPSSNDACTEYLGDHMLSAAVKV
ncbi:hypothetical protein GGI35DRAFT_257153 [Trichoderma velutinum]